MVGFFLTVFMVIKLFSRKHVNPFGQDESHFQNVNQLDIGVRGDIQSMILKEIDKSISLLQFRVTQEDNFFISIQASVHAIETIPNLYGSKMSTNSQDSAESNSPIAIEKFGISFIVHMESSWFLCLPNDVNFLVRDGAMILGQVYSGH